ncbi:tetratricopeptide repeat protein [Vibrio vulnificus]
MTEFMQEWVNNNPGWVVLLILGVLFIVIFRKVVAEMLGRVRTIRLGEQHVELDSTPAEKKEKQERTEKEELGVNVPAAKSSKVEEQESEGWVAACLSAFDSRDINKAKDIFRQHQGNEGDDKQLYRDKTFFLIMMFEAGYGVEAISELERHAKNAEDEKQKLDALVQLSKFLIRDKQYDRAIDMWLSARNDILNNELAIKLEIAMAEVYLNKGEPSTSKDHLINALRSSDDANTRADVYKMLAEAEKKLGNSDLAACCLDRYTQLRPDDLNGLFASAYSAAETNITELAVYNYELLVNRCPSHPFAWNNLGVEAQKLNFPISSVNNYKKATEQENSLAMANLGYKLLHAGYTDEAENYARKAQEYESVHQNVYKLLSDIEWQKETEQTRWNELQATSYKKQALYRKFTEKHYLGVPQNFVGTWVLESEGCEIVIDTCHYVDKQWTTTMNEGEKIKAEYSLVGRIYGEAIIATYRKTHPYNSYLYLTRPTDEVLSCFGFIENDELTLFARESNTSDVVVFKRKSGSTNV